MDLQAYYLPAAMTGHLLAAVIWVGGMFFAYTALRPAADKLLEAPQRLKLWRKTFISFFIWVWLAIIALPATGYWIDRNYYDSNILTCIFCAFLAYVKSHKTRKLSNSR